LGGALVGGRPKAGASKEKKKSHRGRAHPTGLRDPNHSDFARARRGCDSGPIAEPDGACVGGIQRGIHTGSP